MVCLSVWQSQVLLQGIQAWHSLQLLNSARFLGIYNSEEDCFLGSIFTCPDLNCSPSIPVRTEYTSYYHRFFPSSEKKFLLLHSIYILKRWQLIHHTSLVKTEAKASSLPPQGAWLLPRKKRNPSHRHQETPTKTPNKPVVVRLPPLNPSMLSMTNKYASYFLNVYILELKKNIKTSFRKKERHLHIRWQLFLLLEY